MSELGCVGACIVHRPRVMPIRANKVEKLEKSKIHFRVYGLMVNSVYVK